MYQCALIHQYALMHQYGNRREVPIKLSPLLQRDTRTSSSESTPLLLLSPSGGGRAWARTPSLLSAVFSTLVPSLSWQIDHFSFLQDVSFPVQQCVRKNDHFAKTGSGQTCGKRIFSAFYIYSHRIVSSTDSFIGGPPCCRPEAAAFVVRELVLVQAQPRRVPPSCSSSAAAAVSKVCVAQRRSRGGCGRVPPPPMLLLVAAARFIGGACRRARL
eukprot:COSAG06_NODE_11312_length_1527_cov_0.953878_2_plen_215_part_00